MGAKNVKIRLERAVDCENVKSVEQILDKYPDVLNEPFHVGGVFNIGTRAAWRGDLKMLQMFDRRGGELKKPSKRELLIHSQRGIPSNNVDRNQRPS
jgi:hypothetical protein